MSNVTVLCGELSSAPEIRHLDSGTRLATLQVRVREPHAKATSVPVAWWEPPAAVEGLDAGDPVVVVGRVHRRFFRLPDGRSGSRVEVVAEEVAPPTRRRRLAALGRGLHRRIDAALGAA